MSQLGYGGAEHQTLELLKALKGTEWAPARVICLSQILTPHDATIQALGYPLTVIPRAGTFDLRRCLSLHRHLRRDRIRIVHAVNWLAAAYSLLAAPRGSFVVTSIRNSHMPVGRARRFLLRRLLRKSRAILVNSERGRQLVINECHISGDRVTMVPNGVDVERVRQAGVTGSFRRELGISAEAPLVAYVGRNARVKNIPRLLSVAHRVLANHREVRFVIAGEGLDRRVLAGTDLEHESRVHCVGTRRDIPSLLSDATLLLLTSDSEGMPNVVLEALAAGVPVVAPAVGDLPDIVPPQCGALVAPHSEELAGAVLTVLSDVSSYRRALATHADQFAQRFSLETMVSRTIALWNNALPSIPESRDGSTVKAAELRGDGR